jgi:excisionase family DNA binding protein
MKAAADLLHHILNEMAIGNAVTLIPIHAELTTQEAADLLNASRPFLVRLLEEGKIKHHKVGTHRRIKFKELEAYRLVAEGERETAMEELAAEAQELGFGD